MRQLDTLSDKVAAQLVGSLNPSLPAADRQTLLRDFDVGRSHLVGYMGIKLAIWQHWPLKVFCLAHKDERVAKQICQEALRAPVAVLGPQNSVLQEALRDQCQQWLGGVPLDSPGMEGLRDFIVLLRLTPTCERRIEGQHAKLHQRGRSSPGHTEYYQSFGIRSPELQVCVLPTLCGNFLGVGKQWCLGFEMCQLVCSKPSCGRLVCQGKATVFGWGSLHVT